MPKVPSTNEGGFKDILLFLDTDENSSPFDILMSYDAGFDEVVTYDQVTAEKAESLVQDAIFPRGPEGVNHTNFLIGGAEAEEVRKILEKTQGAMFPPFEASIVVDPRGSNTTGSSLVAKVEKGLIDKLDSDMENKKVTILAGTGPVGRVVAKLCSIDGAEVTITSRNEERANNISSEISDECGYEIFGVRASNDEEIIDAVEDADVIVSAGPEGVRIVSEEILEKLQDKPRVVADVNAVPPTGIENLDPNDDGEEIMEGIYGFGALAIGGLKRKVEKDLLTRAKESEKGLFDHESAFESAKNELM